MVGNGPGVSACRLRAAAGCGHDAAMSTLQTLARRAWAHFEPIHAIVYFAPEGREHYDSAGLKGGWMGYFASRSAPMGAVGPEVVTAVFHNFAPRMVQRAIPDAWSYSTPERVLEARLAIVDSALRRLWGADVDSADTAEAAQLAGDAATHLHGDGRPLYAGHSGLPLPTEAHLALWHAASLLREHRFDGHVAALTGYGVSGLEALVMQVAAGKYLDGATMQRFRGWTEEEWSTAAGGMRERGLIGPDGGLTESGVALRDAVERLTDRLAAEPWERLGEGRRERLLALLRPLVEKLSGPGGLVYPNPIGVSPPELS